MTYEQAIRLLHPDTTAEVIAEIEYIHGFRGKQVAINKINKACEIACEVMEKEIPKKPDLEADGYDEDGNLIYDTGYCPNCRHIFEVDYDATKYCPECGQALDWSDTE